MDYFTLIFLGLIVGIVSSFFGIGGATIIVPAFYIIYPQIPATTVIGTGLFIVLLNSIINTFNFRRLDVAFNKKIIIPLLLAVFATTILGVKLALTLEDTWLKRIYAILLLIIVARVFTMDYRNSKDNSTPMVPHIFLSLIVGGLVGVFVGLTGIGGGTLLTPIFLLIYKMRPKLVPAYNNVIMISGSLVGAAFFALATKESSSSYYPFQQYQMGQVNYALALTIFSGVLITSRMGVRLNEKTPDQLKKNLFSALLFILALKTLWSTF